MLKQNDKKKIYTFNKQKPQQFPLTYPGFIEFNPGLFIDRCFVIGQSGEQSLSWWLNSKFSGLLGFTQ